MSTQPRFDYLRTFLTVFRTGSFTSAAKLIGLSQPAVTSQMQALERTLGYPLFERSGRRISPTARAAALAADIAPHIDGLDAITDRGEDVAEDQARVVHLGGPAEYLSERVIPILAGLTDQNLEFRVTFGLADKLLSALSVGAFDIVVSAIYPRLRGVASTPLVDEEFVLVASPVWSKVLPEDKTVTAQHLRKIPLVAYDDDLTIVRRYWRTVFERPPEGLRLVATIPNLRSIREALVSGLGMSALPRYLVEQDLEEGSLVVLLEPEMAPLNTLHVATQQGVLGKDRSVRLVQDALLADACRGTKESV